MAFRRRSSMTCLSLAILCQALFLGKAFTVPDWHGRRIRDSKHDFSPPMLLQLSASSPQVGGSTESTENNMEQNSTFVQGLMDNLQGLLDKYICNGSPKTREQVFNLLDQIAGQAMDEELVEQSIRLVKRAGVPMEKTYLEKFSKEIGKTDAVQRRQEVEERKQWEAQRTSETGSNVANSLKGRSALSQRSTESSKPDLFMNSVMNPDDIATIASDKDELQKEMNANGSSSHHDTAPISSAASLAAANRVSELVAKAGAGVSFDGESLGIGGLNDVLAQIKRRVWTPLAAPPQLLKELGIHPVRGLLLYGKPGCGKTLLARTLGSILSPMRPITVVSGPEIMDKFVGSSEKNLRDIFDNPPDIYDKYRIGESDFGDAVAGAALHVVVMDEFDAIARSRGGRSGKGDQGDAGVARDSVVNQLLAKMDGVHPLPVPTLVIGMTNKRSLIEPALLRPGRFEVQIEVPPPRTAEQRVSILKVHLKNMNGAGRLLVRDPPQGTTAAYHVEEWGSSGILSYEELLTELAEKCKSFSGAALAGVARAAASHALERAVNEFSQQIADESSEAQSTKAAAIIDCLVTRDDFLEAVKDVLESMGDSDFSEDDSTSKDFRDSTDSALSEHETKDSSAPE